MIALWQNTYNRVRPHSSLGYQPPAPVSFPDLAFRLPMAATMQQPPTRLGPKDRAGQLGPDLWTFSERSDHWKEKIR